MIFLWQKPYSLTSPLQLLQEKKLIFAPFAHAKEASNPIVRSVQQGDFTALRDYHLQKGYPYKTTCRSIRFYITTFCQLPLRSRVVIPHRSYDLKADKDCGYLCEIVSDPVYECHHDMYGLWRKIEVIDANYCLPKTIRKSLEILVE